MMKMLGSRSGGAHARVALSAAVVLTASLVPKTPAHATLACTLTAGTLTVNSWAGVDLTIRRNGSNFQFTDDDGPTSCGGTMTNVNTVNINRGSNVAAEHVIVDLAGGQFAPGILDEGSGTSEIEFQVDLGGCLCIPSVDRFEIRGGSGSDSIRFTGPTIQAPSGASGAFLNTDTDLDIAIDNDVGILTSMLTGLDGNDILRGGAVARLPYPWRMTIDGGGGSDDIGGGAANDLLKESAGADLMNGGGGDDTFSEQVGVTAPTEFFGGTGIDEVEAYVSLTDSVSMTTDDIANDMVPGEGDNIHSDVEYLRGGQGDDVLVGGAANNHLFGGLGDDLLDGGAGNDELEGWTGDDTLLQAGMPDGADTLIGASGIDTITYASRARSVTLKVDGLNNDGAPGEGDHIQDGEILIGGHAADSLSGGPGPQTLKGGGGRDTVDYSDRTDPVSVSFDGVDDDGVSDENDDLRNIENVRGGSAGDDITGNDEDNTILGMGGNDELNGGSGDDLLAGGVGNDREFGNAGADTFEQGSADDGSDEVFGGPGSDTIDYRSRSSSVGVAYNGLPDDGATAENDNVAIDVENASGGTGNDRLQGRGGANTLSGGGGQDIMTGAGGGDRLVGGPGPDRMRGEDGADRLLGGRGGDSLNGGPGTDSCDGGPGADTLSGCE